MYGTVLVPTDGSDASMIAVDEAVEITASDGTVHVLSVIEKLPMYRRSGKAEKFERDDPEAKARAEDAVDRVAKRLDGEGMAYETTVTEGVPSKEITSYAETIGADAIVVGKRGTQDSAGDMLGSTTERIIKNAGQTVVSVPIS